METQVQTVISPPTEPLFPALMKQAETAKKNLNKEEKAFTNLQILFENDKGPRGLRITLQSVNFDEFPPGIERRRGGSTTFTTVMFPVFSTEAIEDMQEQMTDIIHALGKIFTPPGTQPKFYKMPKSNEEVVSSYSTW